MALALVTVLYTSQLDTDDTYEVIKDAREKKAREERDRTVAEKHLTKT